MHYSPNGKCAFLVAGSPSIFTKLIKMDVKSGTTTVIRATKSTDLDASYFSIPKEITWDTTNDAKCYGYYYPPQVNPRSVLNVLKVYTIFIQHAF